MGESDLRLLYGPGYNLARKMGYKPGEGLGSEGQGRATPVVARNVRRLGHGTSPGGSPVPYKVRVRTSQEKEELVIAAYGALLRLREADKL